MKLVYKDSGHDVLVGDPVTLEGVTCAVTRWLDDGDLGVIVTADNGMWRSVTAEEIGLRWVEENADLSTPRDRWPPFKTSYRPGIDGRTDMKVLSSQVLTGFSPGSIAVTGELTLWFDDPKVYNEFASRQADLQAHWKSLVQESEPYRLPAQRVAFNATDYIGFSEEQIALIRRGFMAALDQCWELEKQERNFK